MKDRKGHYNIVLDDDPIVAKLIERYLDVPSKAFVSFQDLLPHLERLTPLAAFVDIHLESQCGLECIPTLRTQWPSVPILVLTGDTSENAIEAALVAGADDFLRKPVDPTELKARMSARLEQRALLVAKQTLRTHDLTLSPSHRRLAARGRTVYLSATATNLLACLLEMKSLTVPRDLLKRKVWGKLVLTDNALDRKVYEVRKALADLGSHVQIKSIYGKGYQLVPDLTDRLE